MKISSIAVGVAVAILPSFSFVEGAWITFRVYNDCGNEICGTLIIDPPNENLQTFASCENDLFQPDVHGIDKEVKEDCNVSNNQIFAAFDRFKAVAKTHDFEFVRHPIDLGPDEPDKPFNGGGAGQELAPVQISLGPAVGGSVGGGSVGGSVRDGPIDWPINGPNVSIQLGGWTTPNNYHFGRSGVRGAAPKTKGGTEEEEEDTSKHMTIGLDINFGG